MKPVSRLAASLLMLTLPGWNLAVAQYSASPTAPSSIFPQAAPGAYTSSAISPFPSTAPGYRPAPGVQPKRAFGTGMITPQAPTTSIANPSPSMVTPASPALAKPPLSPLLDLPEVEPETNLFPLRGPHRISFKEKPGPISLRAWLHKKQTLPLSLDDALNLSLGNNITIQIAEQNEDLQRTDFYLRLSDLLPDITGEFRQSKLVGAVQVFGGQTQEVVRVTFQPQITGNYVIYTGGRNFFDIRASKQRLNALKNQTERTRQDTLRQVALAYYDLQAAYWQRSIVMETISEAEQQVKITQGRFEGGIGLEIDALQAKSNLAQQRQGLGQAEEAISEASENLAQLLNLDFEVDLMPDTLDASIAHLIPDDMTMEQLLELAEAHNPQLAMLSELAKAGHSDLKVAWADLFPQIDITAYTNKTGDSPANALTAKFAGLQATWNIGENMGFARALEIRRARTNYKIAQLNLEQGYRQMQQSLANSWTSLHSLEDTVTAVENNYRFSKAAYQQAIGRLQEGVGTNVELQLAQSNLSQARSNIALAFLNYNRVQATLLFNLGLIAPETIRDGIDYEGHTNPSVTTPPASNSFSQPPAGTSPLNAPPGANQPMQPLPPSNPSLAPSPFNTQPVTPTGTSPVQPPVRPFSAPPSSDQLPQPIPQVNPSRAPSRLHPPKTLPSQPSSKPMAPGE